MGEDLILDDGGVVLYKDVFDGESWDLGDEDAAKGVCERGVEADEGEGSVVGLVSVELDGEGGLELLNGEGVVFAGEVAGEICGRDVGDCLFVDANGLDRKKKDLLLATHEIKLPGCHWRKKILHFGVNAPPHWEQHVVKAPFLCLSRLRRVWNRKRCFVGFC